MQYETKIFFNVKKKILNKNFLMIKTRLVSIVLFIIILVGPAQINSQPLAQGLNKFLGAGTSSDVWRNFYKYWNQVTPGNDGKWGSVEYSRGMYNFTNLDKIYNYAKNRPIPCKEHTLVWGQQQPGWISSLDNTSQLEAVEEWIDTLAARYPLMEYVDVVNEPIHAAPDYKDALGGDGTTGWDWVIKAFELARKSFNADTKLLINEYNVLHDNQVTTDYINLINLLKNRNLIDGIGIQGHYFEFRSHVGASNSYVYSSSTIKSNLDKLAETGLPIYITEFDIDEPVDSIQLEQYKIYFPIFWNHPAVKGITFWGYIQNDVWSSHPTTYLLLSNGTERPALQWIRDYIKRPYTPVLSSPINKTDEEINPTLVWNSSFGATSYRVQVSMVRAFNSLVIDSVVTDTLLQLDTLTGNTTYYWRVKAINEYGESDFAAFSSFKTKVVSDVESDLSAMEFKLKQNYPNPFNPETTISFSVAERSDVQITLIDLLGNEIKEIVSGNYGTGNYQVKLNASDLATGIYYYRMKAGNFMAVKKLLLVK
jgi:endo-1,4-beta-xylanase